MLRSDTREEKQAYCQLLRLAFQMENLTEKARPRIMVPSEANSMRLEVQMQDDGRDRSWMCYSYRYGLGLGLDP
jgi:hypothetical protein